MNVNKKKIALNYSELDQLPRLSIAKIVNVIEVHKTDPSSTNRWWTYDVDFKCPECQGSTRKYRVKLNNVYYKGCIKCSSCKVMLDYSLEDERPSTKTLREVYIDFYLQHKDIFISFFLQKMKHCKLT